MDCNCRTRIEHDITAPSATLDAMSPQELEAYVVSEYDKQEAASYAETLDCLAEQVFIAFASMPESNDVDPQDAASAAFDWAEAFLEESKRRAENG